MADGTLTTDISAGCGCTVTAVGAATQAKQEYPTLLPTSPPSPIPTTTPTLPASASAEHYISEATALIVFLIVTVLFGSMIVASRRRATTPKSDAGTIELGRAPSSAHFKNHVADLEYSC